MKAFLLGEECISVIWRDRDGCMLVHLEKPGGGVVSALSLKDQLPDVHLVPIARGHRGFMFGTCRQGYEE